MMKGVAIMPKTTMSKTEILEEIEICKKDIGYIEEDLSERHARLAAVKEDKSSEGLDVWLAELRVKDSEGDMVSVKNYLAEMEKMLQDIS